jgi:hypothetical protein
MGSEDLLSNVCTITDLYVGYSIVCCMNVICFVAFNFCLFNYQFYVLQHLFYNCFHVLNILLSILCVLCFCIVLCICSPHVYSVCHRMENQLQLINIVQYHTPYLKTIVIQHKMRCGEIDSFLFAKQRHFVFKLLVSRCVVQPTVLLILFEIRILIEHRTHGNFSHSVNTETKHVESISFKFNSNTRYNLWHKECRVSTGCYVML